MGYLKDARNAIRSQERDGRASQRAVQQTRICHNILFRVAGSHVVRHIIAGWHRHSSYARYSRNHRPRSNYANQLSPRRNRSARHTSFATDCLLSRNQDFTSAEEQETRKMLKLTVTLLAIGVSPSPLCHAVITMTADYHADHPLRWNEGGLAVLLEESRWKLLVTQETNLPFAQTDVSTIFCLRLWCFSGIILAQISSLSRFIIRFVQVLYGIPVILTSVRILIICKIYRVFEVSFLENRIPGFESWVAQVDMRLVLGLWTNIYLANRQLFATPIIYINL